MERTEQMYTLHTQLDFGKVKVGAFANPSPPYSALLIIGVRGSWGHLPGEGGQGIPWVNFPDSVARRCQGLSRTGRHPQLRRNIWQEPEHQGSSRLSSRHRAFSGSCGPTEWFRTTPLVLPVIVPTLPVISSICPLYPQSLPLISASRWLLKRGELFLLEESSIFRKIASRPTCYLFLFNDVLVVTKKKR